MELREQIILLEKLTGKKVLLEVRVRSSNIKDVDYNKDSKELKIKFMSRPDSTYIFKNVPYDIYEGLMKDKSKGKFFHRKIRNKFGFTMQ
jgi:hypothetical protein